MLAPTQTGQSMQHAHDGEAPTQVGQSTHHGSVNRSTYQQVKQLFSKGENNVGKAPTQTGQSMQYAHDGEAPTQVGQSTHHGSVNRATYQEVKQLFLKDENNATCT
jgi:hypothetical protein